MVSSKVYFLLQVVEYQVSRSDDTEVFIFPTVWKYKKIDCSGQGRSLDGMGIAVVAALDFKLARRR
jgi:hypothetical protein